MTHKLYHGSTVCVSQPSLRPLTRRLDFGAGFYTTSDLEQAGKWARIKKRRKIAEQAWVSIYDATAVFELSDLRVKHFEHADEQWLDFVMKYRTSEELPGAGFDVIRGPVANDTLYETLSLYERGILNHAETIVRLRTHKLANQIVFVTQAALARLKYEGCEEVFDG